MGIIRYSCGFLFSAFVFCYLAFLRGEVLAEIQFVLSKGLTHYSIFVGAIIITTLLQMLQVVVSRIIRVPDRHYYLTYVPSFIALAMLIGMDQNMDGQFVWGIWNWLLPLLLVGWISVVLLIKRANAEDYRNENPTIQSKMWPNFMAIFFMICACGFVSKTSSVYQYEMKAERLLLQKNYEDAAKVGLLSLDATERLTQLRMYALSKQGLLGEKIFTYPQYFGTKGLIDISDSVDQHRLPIRNIEFYLGALPGKTVKSDLRFLQLLALGDSISTEQSRQYLLCYYLLDKKLQRFNSTLPLVYGDTINAELPRAYQEAVIMQNEFTTDSLPIYINKVYVERFAQYDSLKNELKDPLERKNRTRREFGDTYWWYFDN